MPNFEELNWEEAMRRGHAALLDSEQLYDDINAAEGRSNLDIEKHLRRAEVKAAQARSGSRWPASLAAKATAMATQAPEAAVSRWAASAG